MKQNIIYNEEKEQIIKKNEKESIKVDTYYEKH